MKDKGIAQMFTLPLCYSVIHALGGFEDTAQQLCCTEGTNKMNCR